MPRQRMKGPDRRKQIMAVAQRLFAQRGYTMTTTAAIAAAAGVTEPILYRHFSSKRDLFLQLLGAISQQVLANAHELVSRAEQPAEQLQLLMGAYPDMLRKFSEPFAMIDRSLASLGSGRTRGERGVPDVRPLLAEHHREYVGLVADILTRGQAAGQFRPDIDPQVAAWMLINTAIGFRLTFGLNASVFSQPHYFPQTMQMLSESLRAK